MRRQALLFCVLLPGYLWGNEIDQARTLIKQGQIDQARSIVDKGLGQPALKAECLVLLTSICNLKGEYEKGIEYGKQAVGLLPRSSQAHYEYAVALREKMQNASKFRAMFMLDDYKSELAKAIELDPKNSDARREEIGYLISAPGLAGGDKKKARQRIEELKSIDWRAAMLSLAGFQQSEKDVNGAVKTCREILGKYPDDAEVRLQLGFTLQASQQYREADQEFGRAAESTDLATSLSARYQLARSRVLGRYEPDKAVELLQDYINRLPDGIFGLPTRSNAYHRLGMCYELLHQTDNARQSYQKALSLDGKNEDAKKALSSLKR